MNGVIHAAGALRDGLIRNKSVADIEAVLAAKVWGVESLDAATSEEPLDFFILFSSTAGLLGNAGQSDYAYANAYLDSFAHRREELRRAGRRSGRTLSLNWPLWREGGMQAGEETVRFQARELGLRPLETKEGLVAFSQALSSGENQCAIFCGAPQKLLARLNKGPAKAPDHRREARQPIRHTESKELKTQLFGDLKRLVGKVLRLDVEFIEAEADTSEYGFDSITFTALANELNAAFGFEITPAVLFEYRTLETFIDFLCREHGDKLVARYTSQRGFCGAVERKEGRVLPNRGRSLPWSPTRSGRRFLRTAKWHSNVRAYHPPTAGRSGGCQALSRNRKFALRTHRDRGHERSLSRLTRPGRVLAKSG